MEFIKPGVNINFIGRRYLGYGISAFLIVLSILTLVIMGGPKYGIDFAGGTVIQVKFDRDVSITDIKAGLAEIDLGGSAVQRFGDPEENEYLVRTDQSVATGDDFSNQVTRAAASATGADAEIRRVEMVGPQVGQTLREKALFALFYALLFITIYISGRFEMKWMVSAVTAGALIGAVYLFSLFNMSIPILILVALIVSLILFWQLHLRFAMGAIVALIHDVTITVGVFTLVGKEFSLPIVAALLTIIGYSLNDTIIVFDRIRENLRRYTRRGLEENVNRSINETLSRTILTSSTTLIVLLCLFFLGGDIIHDFAFALIVGVLIGTYSSVFVASPTLVLMEGAGIPTGQSSPAEANG
ncbi:MAG: protein translocase subunit SecF [Desulfobacterales bacterium]|nr:protein translocase subunit SecF [Desulfobacterales bacterium]MBS3755689.1 protein translocase subunit SecF [Desulfobacterales bacterium]